MLDCNWYIEDPIGNVTCRIFVVLFVVDDSDRRWWTMESGDWTARTDGFVLDKWMAS